MLSFFTRKTHREQLEDQQPILEFEEIIDVRCVTPKALAKIAKTSSVLVHPDVIADLVSFSARYPENEIGGLLLGRVNGKFLTVEKVVRAERIGTAVNIEFTPRDFENAHETAENGLIMVGWAHSHPTYGPFLSSTDVRFQTQGQGLWPDYTALVIDPFKPGRIEFRFFRVENGEARPVHHDYYAEDSA